MLAARDIQQKLLPPAPRNMPGLSLAAFCEPAREVAGDYYDFLPITDTMIGVLIADVAGQGPGRRPLHGAAEGDRAVAGAAPSRAARVPDGGQPGRRAEYRRQELHHDDVRRHRPRAAGDDLRARRPLPADSRPGRRAAPDCARPRCWRRTAWCVGLEHRRGRAVRGDAPGAHRAARATAIWSCSSPTASAKR